MRALHPLLPTFLLAALLLSFAAAPTLFAEDDPEPPAASPAQIERWIGELGSPDFATRQRASRELLEAGEAARPALEGVMKESGDMEVRWRAEQILRRLDREGERPVGREDAIEPKPQQPPSGTSPLGPTAPPGSGMEDLLRRMEEMRRRMERDFGFGSAFGPGSGFGEQRHVLEAEGLRLEVYVFASVPRLHLNVEGHPRPYLGRSLDDMLVRHPELETHPGMADLRAKYAAFQKENPRLFPFEALGRSLPGGFSFQSMGNGISVTQTPEGVKVTLRETGEDGKTRETVYEGESLEAIKREHPEVAERLKGLSGITVRVGPQVFRGRGERLPLPPVVRPPVTPSERDVPAAPSSFGVLLERPEPVLGLHLGLEPGHGALVASVLPSSPAQALGLLRHDVIVAVDGVPVTDLKALATRLRVAMTDAEAPLAIDVIRKGRRQTLSR